mgnify:CR=1 FL=1
MALEDESEMAWQRALVIGCGYLGQRVASEWQTRGKQVSVLSRSSTRAAKWLADGWDAHVGDVTDPASLAGLPSVDVVLFAVGRDRERTSQTMREVSLDGLRNVLDVTAGRCRRFVFCSSTGVYGQHEGEWVDEDSPATPRRENGLVLVEAEGLVREMMGEGARVLRLAGLYGPDRLIGRRDVLLAGTPLSGRPDAWLNLIHVDDATRAVLAASEEMDATAAGTWVVCDDRPVTRSEFFAELARRVGAPEPQFDRRPGGGRIAGLGKRCRNHRMKRELVKDLAFPDISSGLESSLPGSRG